MSTSIQSQGADLGRSVRPPVGRWKLVVSALLFVWLGAQAVAGWKFANETTYPVVGSAMFNGPPSGAGRDFMVPRVFAVDASGQRTEMDQHTFKIEPFEWRRWIKRNLEDVDEARAHRAAVDLAATFHAAEPDAQVAVSVEVWRVPALHEALDHGHLVRRMEL